MCRPRVGEPNQLFSVCIALWGPTALAKYIVPSDERGISDYTNSSPVNSICDHQISNWYREVFKYNTVISLVNHVILFLFICLFFWWFFLGGWGGGGGTYKVRNEIETKRNEINEIKRNQRKQNEIENRRKNDRGLKEIKFIFTITMLDYFPHMSVFHQERTGFVTIEQEYYAFIQRESVLLTW